jgi:hypothetical protein
MHYALPNFVKIFVLAITLTKFLGLSKSHENFAKIFAKISRKFRDNEKFERNEISWNWRIEKYI